MNYLRLLQLRRDASAEGGAPAGQENAASGGQAAQEGKEAPATEAEKGKTFTQADVDRIVQKTIASERKKAESAAQAARTEAERLASMTAEQRVEAERQQREKALADRERAITQRELRATALEALAQKELPAELAGALNYADADSVNASIAEVEKAFRAAVQKGVEGRMKGAAPKSGDTDPEAALLAATRKAMGLK